MRFLLFNVAVVAALAYLFSMEREDLHAAADRLHDGLDTARSLAREVSEPKEANATDEVAWQNPDQEIEQQPEADWATSMEEPTEAEAPVVQAATATADEAPPAPANLVDQLPPVSDPAVAKRRAEVLEGLAPSVPAARPVVAPDAPDMVLAEGQTLMSDEERLKQLYVLAEEMELLFVQKLAK